MTEMVLPSHTNPLNTVFGGVIMSWVDIASAISAQRHARSHVVTASIDAMHFLAPASLGDNVVLLAQVNNAWQTSMEIEVIVQAEEPVSGERREIGHAYVTAVAVDDYGKPVPVPPVLCETSEEKKRSEAANRRREARLELLKGKNSD
jgi:acyl-CoA hydrolase